MVLDGPDFEIEVIALLDSGCDTTVIPYGIAASIGLDLSGEKDKIYAYRESTTVIRSKAAMTFMGKQRRQDVKLQSVPVLVPAGHDPEETEIVLGVEGIFDRFNIHFHKAENKIFLKRSRQGR